MVFLFELGFHKLFPRASFKPQSSWSLPPKYLGLQRWATSTRQMTFLFIYLFFCGTAVWTQSLKLARQVILPLKPLLQALFIIHLQLFNQDHSFIIFLASEIIWTFPRYQVQYSRSEQAKVIKIQFPYPQEACSVGHRKGDRDTQNAGVVHLQSWTKIWKTTVSLGTGNKSWVTTDNP
jgi:hypothetical protein